MPRARAIGSRAKVASEAQSRVYAALADPTRREILGLLAAGERPAGAIAAAFPRISRPAVSKHLRTLREAGLVAEERHGRERVYALTPGPLRAVGEYVGGLERFWAERLRALGAFLDDSPGN